MGCAETREQGDTHPLAGKVFKMKNVYDYGEGPIDQFVSFRESDLALSATYDENDAVPIKFYKVEGKPHTYKLQSVWPGAEVKWISYSGMGTWLYAWYDEESDAAPIYFKKKKNNWSKSSPGE